jgi:signal transduction histidine kinase
MIHKTVVHVRIPALMDATTYLSLAVMSLLGVSGLHTLRSQLMALGLCLIFGLLYRFVFRTGRYEKNPVLYFGSQFIVMVLLLLLGSTSTDSLNFLFLILSIQAALVLTRTAATLWIAIYYFTVCVSVLISGGVAGLYAAAFYLVAYCVCGFFGSILQKAELAREHNEKLVEELQSTQHKLQELAVVEERNRLARELHDSVKQQVFAISMQLSAARNSLSESDKAYSPVIEAERLAQQAGAELTTLINALRPPGLDSRTLPDAIREQVDAWSRQNHIASETNIDSTISVDQQMEQALFRVLQEALANVARHSQASKVAVALKSDNDKVTLMIEDNGIGYDSERITKGIGTDSMRERLSAVNGDLEISSGKSKGTRVVASVRRS